jgi:Uma2 family endonuclease
MATTTALMTVDEFLKLPDIEEQRVELIQGEVIPMAGAVDEQDCLIPDLSVLSDERVPVPATNALPRGAPDLAVEIVSSEAAARLWTKIDLYLKHGSKAVWAVFPEQRAIEIHSPNGQIKKVEQDEILEDHDALPGFSTPVSAIFKGL